VSARRIAVTKIAGRTGAAEAAGAVRPARPATAVPARTRLCRGRSNRSSTANVPAATAASFRPTDWTSVRRLPRTTISSARPPATAVPRKTAYRRGRRPTATSSTKSRGPNAAARRCPSVDRCPRPKSIRSGPGSTTARKITEFAGSDGRGAYARTSDSDPRISRFSGIERLPVDVERRLFDDLGERRVGV